MPSLKYILSLFLVAAAISVKGFDEASDAIDVIITDCVLEMWEVNEEAEVAEAQDAKSVSPCKGTPRGGQATSPIANHSGLFEWEDPRIPHVNRFIHETITSFSKQI